MSSSGKARRTVIEGTTDPDDPDPDVQGASAENPAFAPTGKRIVFMSGGDLWVVRLDGRDPVQITDGGGDEPDWGRAGR